MASDVAQFLKKNFMDSVQETKQGLSDALTTPLDDMVKEFEKNKGYWSSPPDYSLSCLYQLDYALAECIDYRQQKTSLKRTFSPFSRHDPERYLKDLLVKTKEELIKVRNDNVDANSSSSSFTAPILPTRKDSSYFPGFNEQIKKKILEWLSFDDKFKAIGIYGMCGTGKTTLVKEVLDDKNVQVKYAKPIWVRLSDLTTKEEMDIRIVKEMLACLNDDPDLLTEEPKDDWLVDQLHGKLKAQKLKYLVVLDGVWHCNDWFSNLYADQADRWKPRLFTHALPKDTGGAVIVTSRLKKVTEQLVDKKKLIHVEPWDKEDIKRFLKLSKAESSKKIQDDEGTLEDIAYHCHGLPLVAERFSDWIAEQISKKSADDDSDFRLDKT